jgi:hypothetical protein
MQNSPLELAGALELIVARDLRAGRANDGTTTLLAAANELRRRTAGGLDEAIAQAVAEGMSLRSAASSFGVGVGKVRSAVARSGRPRR